MSNLLSELNEFSYKKSYLVVCAFLLMAIGLGGMVLSGIGRNCADVWAHCYRVSSILHGEFVARPVDSVSAYHSDASQNYGGRVSADIVQLSVDNAGKDPSSVDPSSLKLNDDGTYDVPFNNTAVYSPVAYTPQLIGFALSDLLCLSAVTHFYVAEIVTLVFFVIISILSIAMMPKCKLGFTACLLFPLVWYPYSFAISADSLSLIFCFLFAALLVRCLISREHLAVTSAALGFCGLVLSITKFSNAPLFALAFVVPLCRKDLRRTWPVVFFFLTAVAVDLFWMKAGTYGFATSPSVVSYEIVKSRNEGLINSLLVFIEHFYFSVVHFEGAYRFGREGVALFWLIWAVLLISSCTYIYFVLRDGCRSVPAFVPLYFCLAIFVFAFISYFALWLQYTPDGSIGVNGIQYRYFLPALPAYFVSLVLIAPQFKKTTRI